MQLTLFYEADLPDYVALHTLSNDTFKHAVQVLRLQKGDALHITNGKGLLCRAVLITVEKKQAIVQIESIQFFPASTPKTCIAISLLKNASRLEWFIEKATELGISAIIPMLCNRTEKQHFRYDRIKTILVSAMLQSKQVWLPELFLPMQFSEVTTLKNYTTKLIAHCIENEKIAINNFHFIENTLMLIGPEGDFTEEEIVLAEKNEFIAVTLGNKRLRTETAGVAAAVMLSLNK